MQILARVDTSTSQRSGVAYIDISHTFAEWLLDQYTLFLKMCDIQGPRPLWVTFNDETAKFCVPTSLFSQFDAQLAAAEPGYIVLPQYFVPEPQALRQAVLAGVKPHLIISPEGISWHVILDAGQHHGTLPLAAVLLEDLIRGRL